jgi:hypothetical protein
MALSRTHLMVVACVCGAIGIFWQVVTAGLFAAKDLSPFWINVGYYMFWAYPICPVLAAIALVCFWRAIKKY